MEQPHHIEKVFSTQSVQIIASDNLRPRTSIDVVRWPTFQTCTFKGNESLHY